MNLKNDTKTKDIKKEATHSNPMVDLESKITAIVRQTGQIIRDSIMNEQMQVSWKGPNNPVTNLDVIAEKFLKEQLIQLGPANFIGEELGIEDNRAALTYIMDPIDGTDSLVRREFNSSVSVAVEDSGNLIGGFVYDFMRDILYKAFNGKASLMYGEREVKFPMLVGAEKIRLIVHKAPKNPFEGQERIKTYSMQGSIALKMAQVAARAFDGMLIYPSDKGAIWDIAAGYYLLKTRGLYIKDIQNKDVDYKTDKEGWLILAQDAKDEVLNALFP